MEVLEWECVEVWVAVPVVVLFVVVEVAVAVAVPVALVVVVAVPVEEVVTGLGVTLVPLLEALNPGVTVLVKILFF